MKGAGFVSLRGCRGGRTPSRTQRCFRTAAHGVYADAVVSQSNSAPWRTAGAAGSWMGTALGLSRVWGRMSAQRAPNDTDEALQWVKASPDPQRGFVLISKSVDIEIAYFHKRRTFTAIFMGHGHTLLHKCKDEQTISISFIYGIATAAIYV